MMSAGLRKHVKMPVMPEQRVVLITAVGKQNATLFPSSRESDCSVQANGEVVGRLGYEIRLTLILEHKGIGQVEWLRQDHTCVIPVDKVTAGSKRDLAHSVPVVHDFKEDVPASRALNREWVRDEGNAVSDQCTPVQDHAVSNVGAG